MSGNNIMLEHVCGLITVVAVNAPPEDHGLRDREHFYQKLNSVVGRCPTGDALVVLGDFNTETGNDRAE